MKVRLAKPIDLILSEGKVYGSRYYTVEPDFDAYSATIYGTYTRDWFGMEWNAMVEWCVDTYGPAPQGGVFEPGGRWYTNNSKFWFRNESDRDFFILRWR